MPQNDDASGEGEDSGATPFRAGHVALVGRPNVGKSTLLNALVGQALAAVSHKPQTTRMTVRGIVTGPHCQLVLEDTPGLMDPRSTLDRAMLRLARITAASADVAVAVTRPWETNLGDDAQLIRTVPGTAPVVVAINKIDLVPKESLLPIIARMAGQPRVCDVVPISATERDGLDVLVRVVAARMPESPQLFPPDQVTDQPERFFVAEILREQVLLLYHQEVPYATAVEIEEFAEREHGKDLIRATIWVERESQRMILLGAGGSALKRLGVRARTQMEHLLDRPVYLELWIKVRPKWRDRDGDLARLGLAPDRS